MLTVQGEPLPVHSDGRELFVHLENSEELLPANNDFVAKIAAGEDDKRQEILDRKCIVVLQREMAMVQTNDEPPLLIGSEDATTCVIAVADCRETGWACSIHVDDNTLIRETVELLLSGMKKPVLYLVGAYCDKQGTGPEVGASLLRELHCNETAIDVKLACIGSRNTSPEGKPIARDLLFDTETLRPSPSRVATKCKGESRKLPGFTLRHARLWLDMQDRGVPTPMYDNATKMMAIPAFEYELDARSASFFLAMLQMDSGDMLQHTSTSPEDERQEFADVQRETFMWVLQNPHHTSVFSGDWTHGIAYRWVQQKQQQQHQQQQHGGGTQPGNNDEDGGYWERIPLQAECDLMSSHPLPTTAHSKSSSRRAVCVQAT